MQYFEQLDKQLKDLFYLEPQEVDREDRESFKYAVGANLYMNGTMNLYEKLSQGIEDVGAVTICFEDAIKESDVPFCETSVLSLFSRFAKEVAEGVLDPRKIPAIFIRVRHLEQFISFSSRLKAEQAPFLTGFVFPKFTLTNAAGYLHQLSVLNQRFNHRFYAMPILESRDIVYKETRLETLTKLRTLLIGNPQILNIRVGGTDFSSAYGLRRRVTSTIYDVRVVSDCLTDILNIFGRADLDLVVSGPVWEYFSEDVDSIEVQGLLKELRQDQENGFHGKTSIHPTQAKYINRSYVVLYEEYQDATRILNAAQEGGVFKGEGGNKMNEVGPHLNWAKRIVARAKVFGVLKPGVSIEALYE